MSEIVLAESQTPSNPSAGFQSLHNNASNIWGTLTSAGVFTPFTSKTDVQIRDLIAAMIQNGGDSTVGIAYNSGLGQLVLTVVDNTLIIASSQVTGTNTANGLAKLDGAGQIPSGLLPSFVDDVLEFANIAAFPAVGETGKIYIALDTLLDYRWSGSVYQRINAGAVASVFSRIGAIVAANGDYNAGQVTFTPGGNVAAVTVQAAIIEVDNEKQDKIATGYTVAVALAAVTATDTILAALGKLQFQESLMQRKQLTGVLTNSSNVTLVSLTTMAVNVVAGKTYSFDARIVFQSAAITTGLVLTMTAVTAAGTLTAVATIPVAADSVTAMFDGHVTSLNDIVTAPSVPVANANFLALIRGTFICTTSGTLLPAFRSEINASQITVQLGSTIMCEEMVSV